MSLWRQPSFYIAGIAGYLITLFILSLIFSRVGATGGVTEAEAIIGIVVIQLASVLAGFYLGRGQVKSRRTSAGFPVVADRPDNNEAG